MKKVQQFILKGVTTGARAFKFTRQLEPSLTWIIVFFTLMSPILSYGTSVMTSLIANKIQLIAQGSKGLSLSSLLWTFAATLLIAGVFGHLKRYYTVFWRYKIQYKMRERIRDKRYSLDAGMLKSETFSTLIRRVQEAPFGWNILMELSIDQFEILATLVSLVASAWIVSSYSMTLAFVLLTLSVPQFVADLYFGKLQWGLIGERAVRSKRRDEASSCFQQINALLETKLFQSAPFLRSIIQQFEDKFFGDIRKIENKKTWVNIVADLIFVGGMMYCIYDLVVATQKGEILIGTMMLVMLSGFSGLRSNTRGLLNQIAMQYEQARYLEDVMSFFGLKPLLATPEQPVSIKKNKAPLVEFRDVWFRYKDVDEYALRAVNLTIQPGEKVGIFGENGSGKTTLFSLLSRFYRPTKGNIYINGVNLQDIGSDEWASCISVLLQSHADYDFVVREAVGIGDITREPTDERIAAALRFANADEVVAELKGGYDSQLGESQGGKDLSGGQNKRLAIARRMFAEKHLVMFDEPENKLDARAKEALFTQLSQLPSTTTAIYVSHNLETLGLAKRILVFEKGQLVEDGPGEVLLTNPQSLYRKAMVHSWTTMRERMEALKRVAPEVFAE